VKAVTYFELTLFARLSYAHIEKATISLKM